MRPHCRGRSTPSWHTIVSTRRLYATKIDAAAMMQETTAPESALQQAPSGVPTASPMSPTQGLVMTGPASARTLAGSTSFASSSRLGGAQAGSEPAAARPAPLIAQSSSARDQVRPSSQMCCNMLHLISSNCHTVELALAADIQLCQVCCSSMSVSNACS